MSDNQKQNKDAEDRFAKTEEEAKARFEKFKSKDPFPSILPSLLNSADISDYVAQTGMICPFYEDKLKSASYEVKLLGRVVYWDAEGKRHAFNLETGRDFTLIKNSIAFVTPQPTFRLPDYIALRFNLKITYVERGILLGTGPLVDPGFEGKLLIPLHNLTNNEYILKGGEGFMWAEFTKISELKPLSKGMQDLDRYGKYVPFPDRKKYLKPENYIEKALEGQDCDSIRSSIPESMMKAEDSAKEASDSAKKSKDELSEIRKTIRYRFTLYGIISVLAVVISLFFLYISVHSLIGDVSSLVENSMYYISDSKKDINDVNNKLIQQIESINSRITKESAIIRCQEEEIENLKNEIQDLKRKLENLRKSSEISEIPTSTSGTAKPQD